MSLDLVAIRARWSTYHDRGADDYTDAGCRVLAEAAFRDVPALLAEVQRLRRDQAEAAVHLDSIAENIRLDLVSDEVAAQDIESVARDLRAGGTVDAPSEVDRLRAALASCCRTCRDRIATEVTR